MPTNAGSRLVKKCMSCVLDAIIIAGRKQGVGGRVTQTQLYRELPPRKTVGTSIDKVEKAACVSEVLEFTKENHFSSVGGPEYATVQALLDGQHRVVSAAVGGVAHVFYLGHSKIIENTKRGGDFKTCKITCNDCTLAKATRAMLGGFFGHHVRIKSVHIVNLK